MSKWLIPAVSGTAETWTGERCYIRELMNHPDIPEVSVAIARVEPGVTTQLHRLSVREWYVITNGEGLMEVAGEAPFAVAPGDVVAVPAEASQRITNTGVEDLLIHCVCTPRFVPACYESLE